MRERVQFGKHTQLCDGERPKLNLKTNQPFNRAFDSGSHRAGALILSDAIGNALDDAKQERSGSNGRISDYNLWRRKTFGELETGWTAEQFLHHMHHRTHHLRPRVLPTA